MLALGNLDSSCEWTGGWGVQVVRAEGGSIYLVVQWRQQDLWGFGCHPVTRCTFFPCIMGPDDTSWRLPVNNLEVMSFIELYIVLNLWLRSYGTHGGGEMCSACCSSDNVKTMLPSQVLATNICGKTKAERWAEHKKTCKKKKKKNLMQNIARTKHHRLPKSKFWLSAICVSMVTLHLIMCWHWITWRMQGLLEH